MDRNASDIIADDFHLAGVQADPDLDPEWTHGLRDGQCAADGPGRAVEGGQHAVAERLDLVAAKASELVPEHLVLGIQQVAPRAVDCPETSEMKPWSVGVVPKTANAPIGT